MGLTPSVVYKAYVSLQCGCGENHNSCVTCWLNRLCRPTTKITSKILVTVHLSFVREIPLTKSSNHDDVIKWDIFPVTGPLWGESPVTGGFPSQRPLTQSFGVFFDLRLNKRLSKQSRRRWFETPSRSLSLWRHCNDAENVPMPWHHHVWDVYRAMPHMLAKLIIFGCIQLGLYSLSGKTTYRQISRSLEAARLGVIMIVSLRNLTGISAAMLPMCLSSFRAIGKI